jgi:hypothetical protein
MTIGGNILTSFAKIESAKPINFFLIMENRSGIALWHVACVGFDKICNSRAQ